MNTPKKTKAAVTAQEIATARQALEALELVPPTPAPETITLASGIQELAAQIRGLMKAGYPLEQIAACIKLGGIEMKGPKLRRYLALGDKRGTKTRVKKAAPTTEPKQTRPEPTQQLAVQGTTPTPAQTRPITNPSANPATPTSAITSRVVPPASAPTPRAAAHPATPAAQPPSVPANAPQRSVTAAPATTQPAAVPSTIRPPHPASPVAHRAPTPASYSQANGRTASASRSGDMPTADQRHRDTALLRQAASTVHAQASALTSAEQAAVLTQTGGPTVPPRNPDTLF